MPSRPQRHSAVPSRESSTPKPPVQFSSSITLSDSAQLVGRHTILISSDSVIHPRAKLDSSYGRVHIGRRCIIHERSHLGGMFDFPCDPAGGAGPGGGRNSSGSFMPSPRASSSGGVNPRDSIMSSGSRDSLAPSQATLLTRSILSGDGITTAGWNAARRSRMEASNPSSSSSMQIYLGDFVTVEVGAIIEPGVALGDGTAVGAGSVVGAGAELGKNCTLSPYSTVPPGDKLPDNTVVYGGTTRRVDRRRQTDLRHKAQNRQIEVLRRMVKSDPSKFQ